MRTILRRVLGVGFAAVLILPGALIEPAGAELQVGEQQEPACELDLRDFEPKSADAEAFKGRDGVLFYEALVHRNAPEKEPVFDSVVLRSGRGVLGGTVVLIAKGNCVLGHGFLSALDYIHASEMVRLYSVLPELRQDAHLDLATLRAIAEGGNPVAQFHVGLTMALGWGVDQHRGAGIPWLRRSAESGYAPGMLALGMALSGPGSLEDEAKLVGQPPRTDEFTDRVQACFWLKSAAATSDRSVKEAARHELEWRELDSLMTREERAECERLLRVRK